MRGAAGFGAWLMTIVHGVEPVISVVAEFSSFEILTQQDVVTLAFECRKRPAMKGQPMTSPAKVCKGSGAA
jgi:hypothetical protein